MCVCVLRVWCIGQVSEMRAMVSRLQCEKEDLEKELDIQTNQTHKQVSWLWLHCRECNIAQVFVVIPYSFFVYGYLKVSKLQSQVKASEGLLNDLQKSFSQSQNAVQSRLVSYSNVILQDTLPHVSY